MLTAKEIIDVIAAGADHNADSIQIGDISIHYKGGRKALEKAASVQNSVENVLSTVKAFDSWSDQMPEELRDQIASQNVYEGVK